MCFVIDSLPRLSPCGASLSFYSEKGSAIALASSTVKPELVYSRSRSLSTTMPGKSPPERENRTHNVTLGNQSCRLTTSKGLSLAQRLHWYMRVSASGSALAAAAPKSSEGFFVLPLIPGCQVVVDIPIGEQNRVINAAARQSCSSKQLQNPERNREHRGGETAVRRSR